MLGLVCHISQLNSLHFPKLIVPNAPARSFCFLSLPQLVNQSFATRHSPIGNTFSH